MAEFLHAKLDGINEARVRRALELANHDLQEIDQVQILESFGHDSKSMLEDSGGRLAKFLEL